MAFLRSGTFIVCVCALIGLLQLAAERANVRAYDEGLILYGASRVAHGAVPYRDFWSMYGPGSFYLLAGLDRLFGESVLLGRCLDAMFRAVIIYLMYVLFRPNAGKAVAWCAGAVTFGLLVMVRDYLFPALPAMACALAALVGTREALERGEAGGPLPWLLPGAATGLALLFRQDFGLSLVACCGWALLSDEPRKPGKTALFAAYVLSTLVIAAPLYVYLAIQGADLYGNLVRIPAEVYVANRHLPFPSVTLALTGQSSGGVVALISYLPPIAVLILTATVVRRRSRTAPLAGRDRAARRLFEAAWVLLILLTIKGSVRAEAIHMLPACLAALVGIGLGWRWLCWQDSGAVIRAVTVTAALAGAGLVAGLARAERISNLNGPPVALGLALDSNCRQPVEIPRLRCFVVDKEPMEVLRFLAKHAKPGDTLYVGAGRHDKLFIGNVELYFLSGLPAATRWADTHPGVQTTLEVQRQMVVEMTRAPPRFVVRNSAWDDLQEPNSSRLSSGVKLLDSFLDAHYVVVMQAGTFSVSAAR